jgi:hypothetical protein
MQRGNQNASPIDVPQKAQAQDIDLRTREILNLVERTLNHVDKCKPTDEQQARATFARSAAPSAPPGFPAELSSAAVAVRRVTRSLSRP